MTILNFFTFDKSSAFTYFLIASALALSLHIVGVSLLIAGITFIAILLILCIDIAPRRIRIANKVTRVGEDSPTPIIPTVQSLFKIGIENLRKYKFSYDSEASIKKTAKKIIELAESRGISLALANHFFGITTNELHFEIVPVKEISKGAEVTKISKVEDVGKLVVDLERILGGVSGIGFKPIVPGTPFVGFTIPTKEKNIAGIGNAFADAEFLRVADQKNSAGQILSLPLILGYSSSGKLLVQNLQKAPHVLIGGATGSGKSSCVNTLISGLLAVHTPQTLKFTMIDPKMVDMNVYRKLPHLFTPIVSSASEALDAINSLIEEMQRRYELFRDSGVSDIVKFNSKIKSPDEFLPFHVVVVDEYADLMTDEEVKESLDSSIARLAFKARSAGIHLIICTQRPSAKLLHEQLKANLPVRIGFQTASGIDSKIIMDVTTECAILQGSGDGLVRSGGAQGLERFQGVYTEDKDVEKIVKQWEDKSNEFAA